MKRIQVAAATLNQTPLAWDANRANILAAIERARRAGASLLCLPELCVTGYGCEDAFLSAATLETAREVLHEIIPHSRAMIVSVGLPMMVDGGRYNAACLLTDGRIVGFVGKQHLANDGIHYEPRWFRPWPAGQQSEVEVAGERLPFGDLVFEVGGLRLGFEICEDAWVDDRPGERLAQAQVDVILGPSASHFAFGKREVRKALMVDGSRAFGCGYVFANLLGNEAGRAIYDGQTLIVDRGEVLADGPRLTFGDARVTTAELDVAGIRAARENAHGQEALAHGTLPIVVADCEIETGGVASASDGVAPAWELSSNLKEEEFCRAVALGLFDYLRKSRAQGFVVSLSGGADSAAVATLVSLMVRLASDELGIDGCCDKLSHIEGLRGVDDVDGLIGRLLTCMYQSTRNSSQITRDAARLVAESIGARFIELDVDELVEGYVKRVGRAIGRELSWEHDDLALQNIQARARSPGAWLLANLSGALLLSTSNRSEAAVGYATMDGDTSGGLSPIAGIDKAFLRHWLRWMENTGAAGVGPLTALSAVNQQAPTAELRPAAAGQTDEGDLMPYLVLDAIERAAIRDKLAPVGVLRVIEQEFTEYDRATLGGWVERFFRLWCRNQWKRERYAPSFHLDDENLDPKTWCRFPILSGGFERELVELRALLESGAQ